MRIYLTRKRQGEASLSKFVILSQNTLNLCMEEDEDDVEWDQTDDSEFAFDGYPD